MQYVDNTDQKFQQMLVAVLRDRAVSNASSGHLDEDTLAAFAQGNLTEREMTPAVAHVADCGFCRRNTSELIRLGAAMTDVEPVAATIRDGSVGLTEAISSWFAKLFGGNEAGVFAHGEREDEAPEADEEAEDEDKK